MRILVDLGVIAAATAFLTWCLRAYLERKFASHFAKLDKLHAITLELTHTRLTEAYEALKELQEGASGCRNALRRLAQELSPQLADDLAHCFYNFEASLYGTQLVVPLSSWKQLHIYKRLFEGVITRIHAETAAEFCTGEQSSSFVGSVLKEVDMSHKELQTTLRKELLRLEDAGTWTTH